MNGFRLMAADAVLRNNFPQPEHNVNLDNYRPPALSPLIGAGANGRTIGALGATSAPPPPPPDNPPPPPADDGRARALELLATAQAQLEAIAAAGNAAVEAWALIQAQIAIMALAQEGAADDVAAARAILEG